MATKMAPIYASIFMDALELDMLISYHLASLYYHRYIDDIFLIWTH